MFVLENTVDLSPFLYSFLTFPVHILFRIPLIWSTISAGRDGSPPGSHSPYNVHNLSLALSAGIAKFRKFCNTSRPFPKFYLTSSLHSPTQTFYPEKECCQIIRLPKSTLILIRSGRERSWLSVRSNDL